METETLIIGAGPYGLSLANYLHSQKKSFFLVGKPMELWRNHTFDSMALRSDYATSVIHSPNDRYSFERFAAAVQRPIEDFFGRLSVSAYRQYLDWCQDQFKFSIEEQYVTALDIHNGTYHVKLDDGSRLRAKQVVVATGIAHHLHIPAELAPAKQVIHSYNIEAIQSLQHQSVLVVGAGQSAAESIAVLLEHGNHVEWMTRTQPVYYSEPLNLPKSVFKVVLRLPALLQYLPPETLRIALSQFSATTITPDFQPLLETLPRHSILPDVSRYDAVIAATGYCYQLNDVPFLSPTLKRRIQTYRGWPRISSQFQSSVPGLYFLGAMTEPFFGPSMKFMIGSGYAAKTLARILN